MNDLEESAKRLRASQDRAALLWNAEELGIKLDQDKPTDELVEDYIDQHLPSQSLNPEIRETSKYAKFLKNINTGLVFPYTDTLAIRSDLILCDENGDAVK